ncbi:MAG: trigger factor [Thiobacillus sp.]
MQANLEVLDGLSRRLDIIVPRTSLEAEVQNRLKRLSKTVKMDGFRPGKAPLATIARQYAPGVRQDVLGEALQSQLGEVVQSKQLKIAGYPRFEPKAVTNDAEELCFSALFEVYPEVTIGALDVEKIQKPVVTLGEEDIDKTLAVLQKQRQSFSPVDRSAAEGDMVKFDYQGTVDGEPFPGGQGTDASAVLGEGRLLKEFEQSLIGLKAGDTKGFDVTFPENYPAKELVGKTAHFEAQINEIQAPAIPPVDAEFARTLGVEDGDVNKLRVEVKSNLEREAQRRIKTRVREQVMDMLIKHTTLQLPQSLVSMEIDRLQKMTEADMQAKGLQTMQLNAAMFKSQAERRVSLGLILAELVQQHKLIATPEQIRGLIEEQAQSYEAPEEVMQWYYQSPERMQEIEAVALEENVVAWATGQAQVEKVSTTFEELMGRP